MVERQESDGSSDTGLPGARASGNGAFETEHTPPLDATLGMARANLVAIALLPAQVMLFLAPFALIWGWDALAAGFRDAVIGWYFVPGFLASIIAHEGLHAAGYRYFGRLPRSAIAFGINWRALAPFAHCKEPMTARAYVWSAALPLLALGVLPNLIGVLAGSGWLVFWSFFMSISAGGDIAIMWAVRHVPSCAIVRDHPSRAGCEIVGWKDADQ